MSGIFPPLAMTMFGRRVSSVDRMGVATTWVIDHASESNAGYMAEDGPHAFVINPYIVLRSATDANVTMPLHPQVVDRLFRFGSDSGITLLPEGNVPGGLTLKHCNNIVTPIARKPPPVVEVEDEPAAPKAKKGDKREAARLIIASMGGKTRKEIIKALVEQLGMTDAGASTYHYNLTKGAWK